jgi:predicted nucleotidyltransferase
MTTMNKRQRKTESPEQRIMAGMVRRIVERFHPETIILFGSRARGQASADSDVDLLVVMPFRGSRLRKQTEIRLALREFVLAKDVVVSSPEEFAWRREIPGTIERPAALEGKVLYARR